MTFALDGQIAAHPRVVATVLASAPANVLDTERPIIFFGIGTYLHAARVAADWVLQLSGGQSRASAVDAHHLALVEPLTGDEQVVVISHRGYKRYPRAAFEKARSAGATTVAIVGLAAPEQPADFVIRTCENESVGTFSVSYLASLAALARLCAGFDQSGSLADGLDQVPGALTETMAQPVAAAARLVDREPLILVGFGIDHATVDEAALKIKEGAWLWAEAMSLECSLHGTPAVYREGQGALVILPQGDDGGRTNSLLERLRQLRIETITCGTADADMRFAMTHPLLRPMVAIVPFHRLTAELGAAAW